MQNDEGIEVCYPIIDISFLESCLVPILRSVLAIIIVCGLTGCYNHKFQRSDPPGLVKGVVGVNHVDIGVIEFDDMGELFDRCDLSTGDAQPCQLMSVVKWIQDLRIKAAQGPKPKYSVVVTFIHGWANNADQSNGDLREFSNELGYLQNLSPDTVRYIGVYIGWRGSNTPGRHAIEYFWSVFNREAGAKRVASVSATEAIFRIRDAAKQNIGDGVGDAANQGRFILVGHSFGGLIVERTLAQALTALIVLEGGKNTGSHDCQGKEGHEPFADLAVLINPAIDAIETQEFIDMLKRSHFTTCAQDSGIAPPLLVSIKARNDFATGPIFTVGHAVETPDKVFRDYGDAPALNSRTDPKRPSQLFVFTHTAGALDFFHNYCYFDAKDKDPGDKGCKDVRRDVIAHKKGHVQVVPNLYTRYRDSCNYSACDVWNNTPYWIFTVPKTVVNSHGGWNGLPCADLLIEIFKQTVLDQGPKRVGFR
jgi:pimeloyl-ACP methyl ester carboxylesterase